MTSKLKYSKKLPLGSAHEVYIKHELYLDIDFSARIFHYVYTNILESEKF